MTVIVHSTDRIIDINDGLKARVWVGVTVSGIKVQMLVPRIAALKTEDLSQFDRELVEQPAPWSEYPSAFPLRMIL